MPITDAQWNAYMEYKTLRATEPGVLERVLVQKLSKMFPDDEEKRGLFYETYMDHMKRGIVGRIPELDKLQRLVDKDPEYAALQDAIYRIMPSFHTIEHCEKIEAMLRKPLINEYEYSMLPPILQRMYEYSNDAPVKDRFGVPDGTVRMYRRLDIAESSGGSRRPRRKNRSRRSVKKSRTSRRRRHQ
jgi:hypothetical protein